MNQFSIRKSKGMITFKAPTGSENLKQYRLIPTPNQEISEDVKTLESKTLREKISFPRNRLRFDESDSRRVKTTRTYLMPEERSGQRRREKELNTRRRVLPRYFLFYQRMYVWIYYYYYWNLHYRYILFHFFQENTCKSIFKDYSYLIEKWIFGFSHCFSFYWTQSEVQNFC